MLNMLRSSISGWTAKILLGLLVLSFAVWGIGDVFRGSAVTTVVQAGETEVSLQDYALAYQRATAQFSQQLGRPLTAEEAQLFGVDQNVVSQLVAGALLDEQARRIGLGLSEEELAQAIASDPAFQDASGNFSRAAFSNTLRSVGISERAYIRDQADAAKRRQIVNAISGDMSAPSTFTRALGLFNGERRTIDYVLLDEASLPPVEEPTDEQLQSYFEANKTNYSAPELRSFSYAELTPEALANPANVTDEQIAADYEARKNLYSTPEKRHVRQIVFPDRESAEAAARQLEEGATFAAVAEAAGRSPVDVGLVARAEIPDSAVADAAFSLDEGESSGVVDGAFGPVIVAVEEIQPGSQRPLSEVADEIRNELALAAAGEQISVAYNTFEDARAGGATFAEAAQSAGLTVTQVEGIDSQGNTLDGGPVADLPVGRELVEGVFSSEPGFDTMPISDDANGYVFYVVDDVTPARDRAVDEVRDEVVADWKAEQRSEQLEARAEELQQRVQNGENLAAVASGLGLEVRTAQSVTRQSGQSEIGSDAISAAFSAPPGYVASAAGREEGSRIVLVVREVAPPADPSQNVSSQDRQRFATTLQNDLLDSYINALQSEYQVQVFPAGIERAKELVR